MSFIKCYEYLKRSTAKRFCEFDSEDIIRAEKMLKMELRLQNGAFNTNDVTLLIERLKNKSAIIRFLEEREDFYGIVTGKMDYLKNYPEINFEAYDFTELYRDADLLLSDALNHFVAARIKDNEFFQLKALLKFKTLLPKSVWDSILHRVDGKLNQIYNGTDDEINHEEQAEFKALSDFINLLEDRELNKKLRQIREKQAKELSEMIDHVSKPGIVFFFETLFRGFFYLFESPTDSKEIRNRKRVLKDFRFITTFLGILIGVMLLLVFLIGNGGEVEEKTNDNFSKADSFYKSLYQPQPKEIHFSGDFNDTLKTGYEFFSGHYETPKSGNIITIENKTGFDMIAFFDINNYYFYELEVGGKMPGGQYAYYIKKNSSLTMDNRFIIHFYFGKQLSRVNSNPLLFPQVPRFKLPHPDSGKMVVKGFEFRPTKLIFSEVGPHIQIKSEHKYFMDGISFTEYIFN